MSVRTPGSPPNNLVERPPAAWFALSMAASAFLLGSAAAGLAFFRGISAADDVLEVAWVGVLPAYGIAAGLSGRSRPFGVIALLTVGGAFAVLAGFTATYSYHGAWSTGAGYATVSAAASFGLALIAGAVRQRVPIVARAARRIPPRTLIVPPVLCTLAAIGVLAYPFPTDVETFNRQRGRQMSRGMLAGPGSTISTSGYTDPADVTLMTRFMRKGGHVVIPDRSGTLDRLTAASLIRGEMRGPVLRLLRKRLEWETALLQPAP